jgi:predicted small metal-binding protein
MSLEVSDVLRRLKIHVKTYHNISRKNVVKDKLLYLLKRHFLSRR